MAKGYWIVSLDIHDPEGFAAYVARMEPFLAGWGARYLVRGGPSAQLEGRSRAAHAVVEFPDLSAALACYNSAGHAPLAAMRREAAACDLAIVAGLGGASPTPDQQGAEPVPEPGEGLP